MTATLEYSEFIYQKTHEGSEYGFDPVWIPSILFPFQVSLVEWAIRRGRAAVFADCGLGKTFVQLVWAENIARKTGGRVLILTPLAVSFQTVKEGEKLGVEVIQRRVGIQAEDRIVVTNYERLHYFNPEDFEGIVCDESSILKNFDGETRKAITDFMRKRPYRLLCTATAAPNDYIELGTSSEALGELGAQDMINRFFKKSQKTSSARHEHMSGIYTLRPHATRDFWRWVCSWARAIRKPSDLGYEDEDFILPPLDIRSHVVKASQPRPGFLFDIPAVGLAEQRQDLRRTIGERCEKVADLVSRNKGPSLVWCNLNGEGDRLERLIPDAVQIAGKDTEEHKERSFLGFIKGEIETLITKPTIGGFGLNFQHCAHQTYFPSHSYEQYYQSLRRCWRFGQKNPVTVDMITTEGQKNVVENLERKEEQSSVMFDELVRMMGNELRLESENEFIREEIIPKWV